MFKIKVVSLVFILVASFKAYDANSKSMSARIIHSNRTIAQGARMQSVQYLNLISLFPNIETIKAHSNSSIQVALTHEEKQTILRETEIGYPQLEGVLKPATIVSGKIMTNTTTTQNGGFLNGVYTEGKDWFTWCIILESKDATGLNAHIQAINIPNGVEIHSFNAGGHYDINVEKRMEGNEELWTKTLGGQLVVLGMIYSGSNKEITRKELLFIVSHVGVTNPFLEIPEDDIFEMSRNSQSCGWDKSPCVRDYMCCDSINPTDNECSGVTNQDQQFRDEYIEAYSHAVAKMRWFEGQWRYACTASLLNNADGRVLLMTANHCISKSSVNLELYFNEKSAKCRSFCHFILSPPDTIGMKVLKTSAKSDFTLFEPTVDLPNNGKQYTALGWKSDPVKVGDKQYRIHHPSRGPQSYSEQQVVSTNIEENYIYSFPLIGETMGGSSGSPTVNDKLQFISQHYGWSRSKASYCFGEGQYDTYYIIDGAFSSTFPQVAKFLGEPPSVAPSISSICDDSDVFTFGAYPLQTGVEVTRTCSWITQNENKMAKRQNRWCNHVTIIGQVLVREQCPKACENDDCNDISLPPSSFPTVLPSNIPSKASDCLDSPNYTFGSYTLTSGLTITRNCEWIVKNPNKIQQRQTRWCAVLVNGSLVEDDCQKACGKSMCVSTTLSPSVADSCSDSTLFEFGSYTLQNGKSITRDCKWITGNASKTEKRRKQWCDKSINNAILKDVCPLACNECIGSGIA